MTEEMENTPFSFKGYRFEDLDVWKLGMKIVGHAYRITKKFPKEEQFALSDQLKRTSTSIVLNVAEGSGQPTKKGFCVYVSRSKASVLECVSCCRIAIQEKFIEPHDTRQLEELLKEEYFKLIALHKFLNR
ncbi:MAG: four helix bundle protein [bacterium]|nr:four helix bundle protein [bacterium]